ncbi:MAG TPA: hypothetical protein PLJ21_09905, partial [Pseudobdellovibrionaceae bacterium]|nr:hypothetical protein [Pseudobdellovibrionaceae bacterium]
MSTKTDKNLLPSLLFPGKTSAERKYMAQLKKQGLIYAIGPKLYASVPRTDLAKVVRGSWALIVSRLYSKALISHATALTYLPNAKGEVFLTSSSQRKVILPGLTLCFLRGPKSDKNDVPFMNLKASSFERAVLENLSASKGSLFQKSLSQADIENRLELILLHKGEDELNQCRERARTVSKRLKMETEFKKLDKIIGALLGSRSHNHVMDPLSKARSMGRPYDSFCLERLEILFSHLRHFPFVEIKETYKSSAHFRNKSFFESYFSNYIEGTIFDISEAESIVFDHKIPKQ